MHIMLDEKLLATQVVLYYFTMQLFSTSVKIKSQVKSISNTQMILYSTGMEIGARSYTTILPPTQSVLTIDHFHVHTCTVYFHLHASWGILK